MMRISVVGTGYVGLVSGVCLADRGHQVTCVDKDADKVEKISKGVAPIYEKGLDDLLAQKPRENAASNDRPAVGRSTRASSR